MQIDWKKGWAGMAFPPSPCWAALLGLLAALGTQLAGAQSQPPLQASTLATIKGHLDPSGKILMSWIPGAACQNWTGVVCDNSNNVIGISLTYTSLNGTLSPALGSLSTLVSLNFSGNWMTGPIPDTFHTLTNLQILDLSLNTFSGPLPANIGNLTELRVLNLHSNGFSGSLPSSLGALKELTTLDVGMNGMEGAIPDVFSGWPSLQLLSLSGNNFNGSIPSSVIGLPAIQKLDLGGNNLTGGIYPSLADLPTLKHLNLSGNQLTGGIPAGFALARSPLETLDLSANLLTGVIPTWSPNNLTSLDLSSNQLSGHLVPSLQNPPPSLTSLKLNRNLLEGPMPAELASLTQLRELNLANNFLSGNLPANLSRCTNLTRLDVGFNLLSGPFPPSYATFPRLQHLIATSNTLQGPFNFYDFSTLTSCVRLSFANNQFYGGLPAGLPPSLTTLDVSSNNLGGDINGSIFDSASRLVTVLLSGNQLTGGVPYQLWNASYLQYVAINNNSLTVEPTIPVQSNVEKGLAWILLGGNPICSSSTFPGSTYPSSVCDLPSTVQPAWTPGSSTPDFPSKCYSGERHNCPGQEFPSIPYYNVTGGECLCSQPLNVTVLLNECAFLVHDQAFNLLSVMLREAVVKLIGRIQLNQVWVIGANQANPQGAQMVILQFYGPASGPGSNPQMIDMSLASAIVNLFQSGVRLGANWGPVSFISAALTPAVPLSPLHSEEGTGSSASTATWMIVLIAVGCALLSLGLGLLAWACFFRQPATQGEYRSKFDKEIAEFFVRHMTLDEILASTDNFAQAKLLGEGGYGMVYRGEPKEGGCWAVKRAKGNTKKEALEEFQREVRAISRYSHANVVKLVGYCDEKGEQILIYEFCENGTLKQRLRTKDEKDALSFEQRLDIAIGAAEGLRYMHEFATPAIIHRDIKSDNILLDGKMQAKIADFGLLKDMPKGGGEMDDRSRHVAGTPGYLDPEYFLTFRVTPKSDVYSFGVVLLELITGKLPAFPDPSSTEPAKIGLASWASPYIRLKQYEVVVDPALEGHYPPEAMEKMLRIACDCVERLSLNRPDMAEVANRLGVIKATATIAAREEHSKRTSMSTSGRTDNPLQYLDSSFSNTFSQTQSFDMESGMYTSSDSSSSRVQVKGASQYSLLGKAR